MDITTLQETDFSPKFTPEKAILPRVFELRTYTCPSPEKLLYRNSRFRDHTMGLFKKHGMENLVYWHPQPRRALRLSEAPQNGLRQSRRQKRKLGVRSQRKKTASYRNSSSRLSIRR
jgi:hypothetical protein